NKMYGYTQEEVKTNLTSIYWLPKILNKPILVTRINGVDRQLKAISDELEQKPHLHKYVMGIAGTFNFRNISGTKRRSAHGWGIAIDINVKYSHYWKWDKEKSKPGWNAIYHNNIPNELIALFEKYGFISGARWGDHYDTMHFEWRPELLPNFEWVSRDG
ncbi:MAG: hypothetical protein ACI85I_001324, partial [Arenicella sp.]